MAQDSQIKKLLNLPFDELPSRALSFLEKTKSLAENDALFLVQAIAGLGIGWVSPNPCVGAIICSAEGELLGYGWHQKFGEAHAERNAVDLAISRGHASKLKGSTIYVSLEPCNHHGSQPPCCELIAAHGFGRAVYVWPDPNPEIAAGGKPQEFLSTKGIALERAAPDLQHRFPWFDSFFRSHELASRPYIAIKAAMDRTGCMGDQSGERTKITGARSEQFTHFLRQCFDCVLIGRKTLLQDKPSLTVRRLQSDNVIKRNPSVIVLASSWGQEELSHLEKLAAENRTVITSCKASEKDLLEKKLSSVLWVETASNAETLPAVLAFAHDKGISSILVEGGATVHASLLQSSLFDASLVDRAFLFAARTDVAAKTPSFFPVKQLQGSNTLALRAFTGFDKELVADFY